MQNIQNMTGSVVFTFPLTILKMPPRPRLSDGQASARISLMQVTLNNKMWEMEWRWQSPETYQVLWSCPALAVDLEDRTRFAG